MGNELVKVSPVSVPATGNAASLPVLVNPTWPKPNNRDTNRKVAALISQKGRKAKRNQQEPPLEPEIDLGSGCQ